MSACAIRELIYLLPDGELSADERSRVEAHLAGCEACRAELARVQRIGAALAKGATVAAARAPVGFKERTVARLDATAVHAERIARPRRISIVRALALAASVMLLLSLVYWKLQPPTLELATESAAAPVAGSAAAPPEEELFDAADGAPARGEAPAGLAAVPSDAATTAAPMEEKAKAEAELEDAEKRKFDDDDGRLDGAAAGRDAGEGRADSKDSRAPDVLLRQLAAAPTAQAALDLLVASKPPVVLKAGPASKPAADSETPADSAAKKGQDDEARRILREGDVEKSKLGAAESDSFRKQAAPLPRLTACTLNAPSPDSLLRALGDAASVTDGELVVVDLPVERLDEVIAALRDLDPKAASIEPAELVTKLATEAPFTAGAAKPAGPVTAGKPNVDKSGEAKGRVRGAPPKGAPVPKEAPRSKEAAPTKGTVPATRESAGTVRLILWFHAPSPNPSAPPAGKGN